MNKMDKLDHLAPIADEMLAGLQADETMRLRIVRASREASRPGKKNIKKFAPALTFAAAAIVCVGAVSMSMSRKIEPVTPVTIGEIAAGEQAPHSAVLMADLGDGASVSMARSGSGGSIFAQGNGEIPIVTVGSGVYRMLEMPRDIGSALLQEAAGSVNVVTDKPSLASDAELKSGLSNVAAQSAQIYCVKGIKSTTAVAAQVNGSMRLFQRVSYAGKGPAGAKFEDTFSVRGQVKSMTLDGVGELSGKAANEVIAVLLDQAALKSSDASGARQYLTVTLDSGLKLQLGVSGDTLIGCGAWSCPEFFDAFEKALK